MAAETPLRGRSVYAPRGVHQLRRHRPRQRHRGHGLRRSPGPGRAGSASAVTVGDRANCLLNPDNTVWCWGNTRGIGLRLNIGLRNAIGAYQIDSICVAKRTGGPEYMVGWPCNVFKPVRMSARTFSSITLGMMDEPLCAIDASGTPYCGHRPRQ